MLFGNHGGDGGGIGRPLEGVAQSLENRRNIKMPDFQNTERLQYQNAYCRQPGNQIADHHHRLAVVTVHQHTGKIGKRDPYVVMLSGINRLVYLNCAAEFRVCLIELAAALRDLS